jgi:hypothetical protein
MDMHGVVGKFNDPRWLAAGGFDPPPIELDNDPGIRQELP